ncbi:hypothetical protein GY21_19465 [Cryobacterium roopkundense]|uniref:Type VII secretion system protein EssD-like domain-containing protein n=1 Tax=Cryobacterium roopkundense TaxID=1001240 RepID=A0A099J0P9_9MICO|nr:DNA/RNA non-specific endonuclease [Cryobacterium roopkundense]KGJ71836.1 hypothetical protein GY21_19465 [Cryobacterium roopkundense]MBB5643549.1 hypothetical protein [Cryobacterium roopkundense]
MLASGEVQPDSDLIKPELIPGDDIDPAVIAGSATGFSSAATTVTDKGAAVVTQWAALSGVYAAPESPELLDVMNPVTVDSAALGQTFASLSKIIANFADDVAPVKTRLAALREEARVFVARVADGITVNIGDMEHPARDAGIVSFMVTDWVDMGPQVISWRQHQESVDMNKALVHRVNVEVAALQSIQADCVNAINALRTDTEVAAIIPITASDLDSGAIALPWGAATEGDRSYTELFGVGFVSSLKAMWDGSAALLSYNAVSGRWGDLGTTGTALSSLGMTVAGVALFFGAGPALAWREDVHVPGWLQPVDDFMDDALAHSSAAGNGFIAADQWADNPASAAGSVAANVLTLAIGGPAVAGGKAATLGGRAVTIIGHAAEFVVPMGSWAVRGATSGLLHAGQGLSVIADAARLSLVTGVSTSRVALAEALRTVGDSIPAVSIVPGYSAVTPDGAGFGAAPRLVVGEPGSGGSFLHSVADRVDATRADGPVPPAAGQLDVQPTSTSDTLTADTGAAVHRPDGDGVGGGLEVKGDVGPPEMGPRAIPQDYPRPPVGHEVHASGRDLPGSRTPFAARTDLLPDTVYHVEGRGDFYTNSHGTVNYVETTYGGTRNLNADLMHPQPDTTYVVHPSVVDPIDGASYAHVFQTDDQAHTVLAHTDRLAFGDADRSPSIQSTVAAWGGAQYDGGHLWAKGFGGGGEYTNMSAMLTELNRGGGNSYFNLENTWRGMLKADPNTKIEVDIRPHYPDGEKVPDVFTVRFAIDGERSTTRRFENG